MVQLTLDMYIFRKEGVRLEDAQKMREPELVGCFEDALQFDHIYAVYQPQINHSTGRIS